MNIEVPPIVMYARTRFCPDVSRSRERLTEFNLGWQEFDIEANEEAARRAEKLAGRRVVPTIVIGTTVLVEPTNDELDAALIDAGYSLEASAV